MASKLFPLLAAGAALLLLPKKKKAKKASAPTGPKVHDLSGIYAENAALGASSGTMEFLILPVGLSIADPDADALAVIPGASRVESLGYRDPSEGTVSPITVFNAFPSGSWRIQFEDGSGQQGGDGALDSLGQLVTNLTPDAVNAAYKAAQDSVMNNNDVYDEPSGTLDATVYGALKILKPETDWPASSDGLEADDPLLAVWNGMSLIASLAYQTQVNFNA
jgi:hypothetical protein